MNTSTVRSRSRCSSMSRLTSLGGSDCDRDPVEPGQRLDHPLHRSVEVDEGEAGGDRGDLHRDAVDVGAAQQCLECVDAPASLAPTEHRLPEKVEVRPTTRVPEPGQPPTEHRVRLGGVDEGARLVAQPRAHGPDDRRRGRPTGDGGQAEQAAVKGAIPGSGPPAMAASWWAAVAAWTGRSTRSARANTRRGPPSAASSRRNRSRRWRSERTVRVSARCIRSAARRTDLEISSPSASAGEERATGGTLVS